MASKVESLFLRSPVWLQQLAVTAWGVVRAPRRFGGSFARHAPSFADRDELEHEQIRQYRESRLRTLFEAAWQSPYYWGKFSSRWDSSGRWSPGRAMGRAPFLSKETLVAEAVNS